MTSKSSQKFAVQSWQPGRCVVCTRETLVNAKHVCKKCFVAGK